MPNKNRRECAREKEANEGLSGGLWSIVKLLQNFALL